MIRYAVLSTAFSAWGKARLSFSDIDASQGLTTMHPYLSAAIGGVLIGISATLLMAMLGRIAGISGIVGNLLQPALSSDTTWRIAFLVGLVAAPLLLAPVLGRLPVGAPIADPPLLGLAGLLVGAGTTLGSGCTSGHGICGLARLSPRSVVAVVTFIAVGVLIVFIVRHA